MTAVQAHHTAAHNVLLGWMGAPIPEMPKQRNKTRAGYRKTMRRRGDSLIEVRRPSSSGRTQLELSRT